MFGCYQAVEIERDLRLLKSRLLVAQAKHQSLKLQILYAQVMVDLKPTVHAKNSVLSHRHNSCGSVPNDATAVGRCCAAGWLISAAQAAATAVVNEHAMQQQPCSRAKLACLCSADADW